MKVDFLSCCSPSPPSPFTSAARGLDFPAVDWVVQVDCPEDVATYIHRVGRTARYDSEGKALLLLLPSEEKGFDEALKAKKVPVEKIQVNPKKAVSITKQLQSICSEFPEIKYLGQKSLISYVRSVHLRGNKDIFSVEALPLDEYAISLGLPGAPKMKFVSKAKQLKNQPYAAPKKDEDDDESDEGDSSSEEEGDEGKGEDAENVTDDEKEELKPTKGMAMVASKVKKMFARKNQEVMSEHYAKLRDSGPGAGEEDDEEEFMTIKRRDHEIDADGKEGPLPLSRRDILKSKKKYRLKVLGNNSKLHFDDEGNVRTLLSSRALPCGSFLTILPLSAGHQILGTGVGAKI